MADKPSSCQTSNKTNDKKLFNLDKVSKTPEMNSSLMWTSLECRPHLSITLCL